MKCKILFSGRNEKTIINLLSAEFALRVVKVNFIFWIIQFLIALDKMSIQLIFFFFFFCFSIITHMLQVHYTH